MVTLIYSLILIGKKVIRKVFQCFVCSEMFPAGGAHTPIGRFISPLTWQGRALASLLMFARLRLINCSDTEEKGKFQI